MRPAAQAARRGRPRAGPGVALPAGPGPGSPYPLGDREGGVQSLPRLAAASLKQMSVFRPLKEVLFYLPKVQTFRLYKAANSLGTIRLVVRRDVVPIFSFETCLLFSLAASKMIQVDGRSLHQVGSCSIFKKVRYTFPYPWLQYFLTNIHGVKSGYHLNSTSVFWMSIMS